MEPPQLANRYRLEAGDLPLARLDDPPEPRDCHAIQADRLEARMSVVIEMGEPPQKCPLRKDEVRPWEYGKNMAAQRVIPGRAERSQHEAAGADEPAHRAENSGRIRKVLE